MILIISGFIGILGVMLLNVSRNLPLTIGVHLAVLVIGMAACVWKSGSVAHWVSSIRSGSSYSIHPGWVALIGLLFASGGFSIVCLVDPNDGPTAQNPNTMTPTEARYFACIFIQLGLGITAVSLGEVIHRRKKKRSPVLG